MNVSSQTEEPIEITWEDLGYTSLDVVYVDSLDSYFNEPVFNSGVSELVGKQIKIKGYFQCIHQETEYYWLSKDKIASYGCIEGENPFMTIDISNCTGLETCLLYTSPSPRDRTRPRMQSSA